MANLHKTLLLNKRELKISFEEFYIRYVCVCKYPGKTDFSINHRQFFVKDFSQQKSSQPFCSIPHDA